MAFDIASFGISADQLPNGWIADRLDTLAYLNPEQIGADYPYQEIAYLDISNVERGLAGNPIILPLSSAPSRAKRIVRPGDTILSTVRPGNRAYTFLSSVPDNLIASTGFVVLRAKPGKADPRFIYYIATCDPLINYLASIAEEKTAYPSVNPGDIAGCTVPIPMDPAEQHAIGQILGTLDDKIELNRRMNETLEAIARAIFKSWFVDFDPVRAKASGEPPESICRRLGLTPDLLALFPDRLVESELGEIPEGWEVWAVRDIGNVVCGKTPPTKNPAYYGDAIPFVTIPDMHGNVFATTTQRKLSHKGAVSQAKKTLPAGSICVSCIATPGLVVITTEDSQTNQQINSVVPEKTGETYYWFWTLRDLGDEIRAGGSGGSVLTNLSTGRFSEMRVLAATVNLRRSYQESLSPLFEAILSNAKQTRTLAGLRDTLLPKLLSGELRVPVAGVA